MAKPYAAIQSYLEPGDSGFSVGGEIINWNLNWNPTLKLDFTLENWEQLRPPQVTTCKANFAFQCDVVDTFTLDN